MIYEATLLLLGVSVLCFVAYNFRLGRAIDKGMKWKYRKEEPGLFGILVASQFVTGLILIVGAFINKSK